VKKVSLLIVTVLSALLVASPAFASGGGNNGDNGDGNGSNSNRNHNRNTNRNTNNNRNNNDNNQSQHQSQFQAQGQSQKSSQKSTQANEQSTTFNEAKQAANPPSASAPSLTSVGADNCLGSVSVGLGGGAAIGGGALSFGKTIESKPCNRRANAKLLFIFGQQVGDPRLQDAAVQLLMKDKEVQEVMKEVGIIVTKEVKNTPTMASADDVRTDYLKSLER